MLKTLEEIKEVEVAAGVVINGVDNPNMMSVDSTEPVETKSDKIVRSEEEKLGTPDLPQEEEKGVETEVEAEAETKIKSKSESKPESDSDSPKVSKRIGDLTKKWRTAEREREFEKQKRLEAEAKLKEAASKIPAEDRPLKEDFDDEDDYIEALTDWKIETKLKASQEKVVQEIEDKDEQQAVADAYEGLDDAMDKGKEKYEDFNDLVLNEDLIVSPELTEILLDTEVPEDIMYYLASNPDESERISGLDPLRVAKEVGKIEVKLAKAAEKEVKEEVKPKSNSLKKQSNAPEPIAPVKTTGVTGKDPNKMSPKEYREWREKSSK